MNDFISQASKTLADKASSKAMSRPKSQSTNKSNIHKRRLKNALNES